MDKNDQINYDTYRFHSNYMPVLRIRLVMRILHQGIVLEDTFPVLIVFPVSCVFSHELLNRYLVTVEVLEYKVIEMGDFILLPELDFNVGLAGSL